MNLQKVRKSSVHVYLSLKEPDSLFSISHVYNILQYTSEEQDLKEKSLKSFKLLPKVSDSFSKKN